MYFVRDISSMRYVPSGRDKLIYIISQPNEVSISPKSVASKSFTNSIMNKRVWIELYQEIISIVTAIFIGVCSVLFIIKSMKNSYAEEITEEAEVIDKYITESIAKTKGVLTNKQYIVVFLTKKKRLYFQVSEFSYYNYEIKDKGKLTYKGNMIIGFE